MSKKAGAFLLAIILTLSSLFAGDSSRPKENSVDLLVISCSLNPNSRSAILAKHAFDYLKSQGQNVELLDLRDFKLPLANGHDQSAYDDPQVKVIHDRILKAKGIIIATPIYNNNVGAVAKNLIELTTHAHKTILSGTAWNQKVVGFMGTSGGCAGTWAFFPFLNGLMIDAKVLVVPTFVMASNGNFNDNNEVATETKKRVEELSLNMIRFANVALASSFKVL